MIRQISPLKTSRLDGMHVIFIKNVSLSSAKFFYVDLIFFVNVKCRHIHKDLVKTYLSLIPEKVNLEKVMIIDQSFSVSYHTNLSLITC